jgi:hypothetical protein
MSKPKAPPAPDYVGAAQAQGAANVDAARVSAKLSNPNIINPYGKQTVTYGGEKVFDQAAYDKAMQDFNSGSFQTAKNFDAQKYLDEHPDVMADKKYGGGDAQKAYQHYMDWGKQGGWEGYWKAPDKSMFTTDSDPDKVTVQQELSPEQQKLFEQDNRISQGLGDLAEGGIGRVGQMLGTSFDMSKIPGMVESVNARYTDPRTGEITKNIGNTNASVQAGIDPRFDQTGDQVQEALYRKQTRMLDPQYQQSEADMAARLANQGIMQGSEAYQREMDNFARNRDSAYADARDRAILASGQEQSRLNDMGMSRAVLNNSAQGQEFDQLSTRAGFNNQAVGQMFGQELGANNQNFNQDMASANFANQARQNAIQEQTFLRQLPLNEINALRSGSQVTMPQFQGYSGQQVGAAPIFGATQAQGQWDQGAYNARAAQSGNMMNGLFSLGSAALLSDVRAKENIRRVGYTDSGLPVYTYNYIGGNVRHMGVMAQEVEKVDPSAVVAHPSGLKMVDYSKVK